MNASKLGGWMVVGTLALLAVVGEPAAATGGLAGTGAATFFPCPTGSDKQTITGVEDGGIWTILVTDHHQDTCSPIADAATYTGAWDPAVGHDLVFFSDCMIGDLGGFLCLGPVPTTGTLTTTGMHICMPIALCMPGTADLVRV